MTSCNPCSYISVAAQIQELRNSFTSTNTDLPCNKYKHTQGLPWLSPKKIPALLMHSWRFQRTLKELNPPVCRERLPCQEDKKIQGHFYTKHQLPLEWPVNHWIHCCFLDTQLHCWMGSGGSAWLKMESRGNPPQKQRALQIHLKNKRAPNPPQNRSGPRSGGTRTARNRKRSKWVCGTTGSQLTQPQLQISGAEAGVGLLWESKFGDSGHVSQRDSAPFFNLMFSLFAFPGS